VYILGHFGVRAGDAAHTLVAAPLRLKTGDWVRQGLPFYGGSVTYLCQLVPPKMGRGERLIVRVPDYRGVGVRVLANGREAGRICWPPNEVDLTDLATHGPVDLRIEVLGHRRNSHGPFHISQKWPTWTGPAQFITTGEAWFDGYQLVPCGLMASPEIEVRRPAR
jgi:hypothetical protein